jgi:hypothetical protein
MAVRPSWEGLLRLSLVACPVAGRAERFATAKSKNGKKSGARRRAA